MMLNCTIDTISNSHSSKWMPLNGVYIATATLVCAIAMTGDLVEGLQRKQYWIPSWYTSLNSISLTILGAATKLSLDLSTPMPRHIDQLTKLGTSAFMCIALASIQPSLGKLEDSELLSNTIALSILVISSIVNLCIQLRAGVIYTFKSAHVIMLTMMTLLLVHCVSSAGFVSYIKRFYETDYQEQHRSARNKWVNTEDEKHLKTEKLKQYLKRFSLLAHSGCPHFLFGRTFQGTLPMIYGLVVAITFFVTQISSITHEDKFLTSSSGSSISVYKWSALWIFITQTIALGVGTIVLCFRGCYIAMDYLKGLDSPTWKVRLEKFWMKKDNPEMVIFLHFFDFNKYSQYKSLVYKLRKILSYSHFFLYSCLFFISMMGFHFTHLFWICIMSFCCLTTRRCFTGELPDSPSSTNQPNDLALEEEELSEQYICPFPLLEKEGSAKWIMKCILYVTQKYMSAKERNTEHLEELLRQYLSRDFRGVFSFDNEEVVPLDDSQGSPPNCWSLPVVTLTRIAMALPNVDRHSILKLIKGVNEGLVFAKLIEDKFNNQPHLCTTRSAAYSLWGGGLRPQFRGRVKPTFQIKGPIEIIESIATSAANDFHKFTNKNATRQVAAHSKYRLCKTILLEHRNETQDDEVLALEEQRNENIEPTQDEEIYPSSERIFEKLRTTIADILGACLTNLNHYILMDCFNSSSIEKRRDAASCILKFFGDTEKIMEIVEARDIPDISPEKMVFIDEWRKYHQHQRQ